MAEATPIPNVFPISVLMIGGFSVGPWGGPATAGMDAGGNLSLVGGLSVGNGSATIDSGGNIAGQTLTSGGYLRIDLTGNVYGNSLAVGNYPSYVQIVDPDGNLLVNAPTATNATNDANGNPIASTYATIASLAKVATSGVYSDLSGTPTIPAAQVNSDWNASSGLAEILNKPALSFLPLSGGNLSGPLGATTISSPLAAVNNANGSLAFKNGSGMRVYDGVNGYGQWSSAGSLDGYQCNADGSWKAWADLVLNYYSGMPVQIGGNGSTGIILDPTGTTTEFSTLATFDAEVICKSQIQISAAASVYSGSGVPSMIGKAGDLYFRTGAPSTANQRIYICTANGNHWTGIL